MPQVKYTTRKTRRNWDNDDLPLLVAQTVHEPEKSSFSGLYDASGQPLYREPTRVGFALDRTK